MLITRCLLWQRCSSLARRHSLRGVPQASPHTSKCTRSLLGLPPLHWLPVAPPRSCRSLESGTRQHVPSCCRSTPSRRMPLVRQERASLRRLSHRRSRQITRPEPTVDCRNPRSSTGAHISAFDLEHLPLVGHLRRPELRLSARSLCRILPFPQSFVWYRSHVWGGSAVGPVADDKRKRQG
jgi:hypothetical protein